MLTKGKIEIDVTVHGENSFKHLLNVMSRVRDTISDINQMTPIQISILKDKKHITIEGPVIESGRIIYFMGGTLDVDTGYMLSSYDKGSGFAMFNLYDFLFLQDPQFDKDEFLLNLENLKLNEVGNKYNFKEVVKMLFSTENKDRTINPNSSICNNALKTLRVESKNGSSLVTKRDDKFYDKLARELFLNVSAYLDFRRILDQFMRNITRDVDKFKNLNGEKDFAYKIVEDDFNLITNTSNYAQWIDEKTPAYTYLTYYNSFASNTQEEFKFTKDLTRFLEGDANWVYDRSYNTLRFSDKKPKEGKAERLFNNLKELLRVSKNQDDEMELYNTLTEEYDVAKKKIKKTSFKDIIKGSYLTNVLKNVSTVLRIEKNAYVLRDTGAEIPETIIKELIRLNNHLTTLIKKALSVL